MSRLLKYLNERRLPLIFGVVHLRALPGTPRNVHTIEQISAKAVEETEIYVESGIDGIIVENMGDVPYVHPSSLNPETVAFMTRCAVDARQSVEKQNVPNFLWGISTLAACNKEAVAVAVASEYDFVRCEGFVFAHVADEGTINACAGDLLRYRKSIGADLVSILTDIKKKHSAHAITADVSLMETAEAAEFFLSDGVIVTGAATGKAPEAKDVQEVKSAVKRIPVLVGSGITSDNVGNFADADALIVGSHFKKDGFWSNEIDVERLKTFMNVVRRLRGSSRV